MDHSGLPIPNPPDHLDPESSPRPSPDESRAFSETMQDGHFSLKISEEMALRNLLRSGLVEAQGKDGEHIPLFISWPHWLEDGIVCMYVKDFQRIIDDAVKQMAMVLENEFSNGEPGQIKNTHGQGKP
jgi:hypothetical protein